MKKLRTVFVLAFAATLFAAACFANNVVAVVRWWQAFRTAGGDSAGMPAQVTGFWSVLDWSVVDYSAVTTFIPLLGLVCLTRAAWRLLRGRRIASANFPFFAGSDQVVVALGLLGTLWGIIVIGYYRLDTVQMADLMQCLHTALFSTLMAVVWVFLLDRPLIRPYFVRLLEAQALAEPEEGELAETVNLFTARLMAASAAFDARQKQYEAAFDARQKQYETAFETRQKQVEAVFETRQKEIAAAFDKRRREADDAFARNQAAYERAFETRQKEYVETFRREIAALKERADVAETKLRAVLSALQA